MYRAVGHYFIRKAQQTKAGRAFLARLGQYLGTERWARPYDPRGTVRDLDAIAGLTLPENLAFKSLVPQLDEIEGMFSPFSMSVIDSLLSFQKETGVRGDMLEFGVYRGKSAALIGRHLNPTEHLTLVDIADYLDRRAIALFQAAATFMICGTEDFKKKYASYNRKRKSFRFIHIDASHAFRATFRELQMADELLADDGVIAMDDFANLNYSQNIAAIFKYLFTTKTDLTIFLTTNEKAYLCRRSAFGKYASFVLDRMLAETASRGVPSCLARTDTDREYRAFYLRPPEGDEDSCFYGLKIYRGLYQGI
jgi:hypothetical protein